MLEEVGYDIVIYGSAANGLFEQPLFKESKEGTQSSDLSSDLDLTLIPRNEPRQNIEE